MEKAIVIINNKKYNVFIAKTEEEQEKGLQNIDKLPENEGMLFIFEEPQEISFWMKNTNIPLDIVFINEDLEVISVKEGIPNSEELITEQDVMYVLEVNSNSEIQKGDDIEFETNSQVKSKMMVLDSNGESQMELDGGERIFSRKNTKILIKFAKKAYSTENDNDYKALGKRVFKFLKTQDSNESEYVSK